MDLTDSASVTVLHFDVSFGGLIISLFYANWYGRT